MSTTVTATEVGAGIAVSVASMDEATQPLDAPVVNLPGVGPARAYVTALDAQKRRMAGEGFDVVASVVVRDKEQVVTVYAYRGTEPTDDDIAKMVG